MTTRAGDSNGPTTLAIVAMTVARMKRRGSRLVCVVLVLTGMLIVQQTPVSASATFVVNSIADASDAAPGDGACGIGPLSVECTLRAAIQEANASPGVDVIRFGIGTGHQTITPVFRLPVITEGVTVDGWSQPGAAPGAPIIELDGTDAVDVDPNDPGYGSIGGAAPHGLEITAGGSVVRGLVINRFGGAGIRLHSGGGNVVEGNFIGTDVTGTERRGNASGILIEDSDNNTIGGISPATRNLLSGNAGPGPWDGGGVVVLGGDGTQIQGNYIGTNVDGTGRLGNQIGVLVATDFSGLPTTASAQIGGPGVGEGNVVSGNGGPGIEIRDGDNVSVQGNLVGTDPSGTEALGNGEDGITVGFAAPEVTIGGSRSRGEGNVISGNGAAGIGVGAERSTIQGNLIGTDATGTARLGNGTVGVGRYDYQGAGIAVRGSENVIGGFGDMGNVVSANGGGGVLMSGCFNDGNRIQGNVIGTDIAGIAPLGNEGDGVVIVGDENVVGGGSGAGNVIAANDGNGVRVSGAFCGASANHVVGNRIGTGADGRPRGNGGHGVLVTDGDVRDGAVDNVIGGSSPGLPNVIAYNGKDGVRVLSTETLAHPVRNTVIGNSIYTNGELGIDLDADGVTPNDGAGDPDAGDNERQNFPVLTAAKVGGPAMIEGTLGSTPNTVFFLEFFSNSSCDPSEFGEAETSLGSASVTTDGQGFVKFKVKFPAPPAEMTSFSATATDREGNTSELSKCRSLSR